MSDKATLTVAEAEKLVDEAASRIRDILDKVQRDTGFTLDPEIATETKTGGEQFFFVRLNARIGDRVYYHRLGK